ncbi:pilin, partial [Neisseria iguanae]
PLVEAVASSSNAVACKNDAAWYKSAVQTGKYVEKIEPSTGAAGTGGSTCALIATFKASAQGVNDKVAGKTITMTLTPATGAWACTTNLDDNIAPAACRNTTKTT